MLTYQNSIAQKFNLGDALTPTTSSFTLLGISSQTGVYTYNYIKQITDKMFERKIDDIIIGIKDGRIVTTIYDLIPLTNDIGVPSSLIKLVETNLTYPLTFKNGVYGVNIDNTSIGLSRSNNSMTFNKGRIMYFSSIKISLLKN